MSIVPAEDMISGEMLGTSIFQNLLHKIEDQAPREGDDLVDWFERKTEEAKFYGKMEEGFGLLQAVTFYYIEKIWSQLPAQITGRYGHDFDIYLAKEIPSKAIKTLKNYIRAAETYLVKGLRPPEPVKIIENRDGKEIEIIKQFDPTRISPAKLILARSAVEAGRATPELWAMLTDDRATWKDVRSELFSPKSKEAGIDPAVIYEMLGPALIAKQNGHEAIVCTDFNWGPYYDKNHEDHELVKQAIDRISQTLNVLLDDEVLMAFYERQQRAERARNERRIR